MTSSHQTSKLIKLSTSSTPTWKLCTRKVSTNLPVHLRGNSSCWTPSFNAWACKKPLRKPLIRWFVEEATSKTKRKPKQRGFFLLWGGGGDFFRFQHFDVQTFVQYTIKQELRNSHQNMLVQITDTKFDWLAYEKGDQNAKSMVLVPNYEPYFAGN